MPIVIPRKLAQKDDLVVIPRKEYEEYLEYKEDLAQFELTKPQKKALTQARKNLAAGKFLTLGQLKQKLEIKS